MYAFGLHLFEDVFVDLYFIARLLNPGGVVALMTVLIRTSPKC